MGEPKQEKVKYDEAVKNYTEKELQQHHDDALSQYINEKGEISLKVLSRVGKVPEKYIREWMKKENWAHFVMEDEGDKIHLTKKTKEFIQTEAGKLGLNEQEEAFCYHFYKSKNAAQAAIKAGYDATSSYIKGYELLKRENIRAFLRGIQSQACEEVFVDIVDILRMWSKIAFADINDYISISESGVLLRGSSVMDGQVVAEVKEGANGITIKLADRMKALDRLSSYLKILPNDKSQEAKRILLERATENTEDEEPLQIEIVGV